MLMQQEQDKLDSEKVSRWQKVLYVAYIMLIVTLVAMFGARFSSLCAKRDFRKFTVTYPTACSDWALDGGCTYISLTDCYNEGKIPDTYVTMWETTALEVNNAINSCVDRSLVAKFQSPHNGIYQNTDFQPFIHVTWTTGLLGVIDDMFLQTYKSGDYAVVDLMS
jgi:hypothetical protein